MVTTKTTTTTKKTARTRKASVKPTRQTTPQPRSKRVYAATIGFRAQVWGVVSTAKVKRTVDTTYTSGMRLTAARKMVKMLNSTPGVLSAMIVAEPTTKQLRGR